MTKAVAKETFAFQTEVKQLLHLVVHSLYSNKEIFLRELISNASDALDKLRFEALSHKAWYENDPDLKIKVEVDEKEGIITVSDNGIGMSREEVIEHIGTIAKSGTKDYLAKLNKTQLKNANFIGQFGVGFYSIFMVADKVTLKTRRAGLAATEGVLWESSGEEGAFTMESILKESRGTEIVLHIKPEEKEFLNRWRLRSIITKYADHVSWPIVILQEAKEDTDKDKITDNKEEVVNKATALWTLPKSKIKEDDYKAFYKHIAHDYDEPLIWSHHRVEGNQQYTTLLFIPKHAPYDLFQPNGKHGLKLYVQRVYIMDEAESFLPNYLRFVKGIVDSSDLPLNVSRELLQNNPLVETIKSAVTKKVLTMLEKLSQEPDNYQLFWKEFGKVLKEGLVEDTTNRDTLAKLLRFNSTLHDNPEQPISLDDYLSRMKEKQDKIYYLTSESLHKAKYSPHLEYFKSQGIEVLLLCDRVDEWVMSHLNEYQGKSLQSIAKGTLDNPADEASVKALDEFKEKMADLIKRIQDLLKDHVKEVRLTNRLTDSPACLVVNDHEMGLEMQRLLKASGQLLPSSKPILEMNPYHPLIQKLDSMTDMKQFENYAWMLYDQAILAEGGQLENPGLFVKRLNEALLLTT